MITKQRLARSHPPQPPVIHPVIVIGSHPRIAACIWEFIWTSTYTCPPWMDDDRPRRRRRGGGGGAKEPRRWMTVVVVVILVVVEYIVVAWQGIGRAATAAEKHFAVNAVSEAKKKPHSHFPRSVTRTWTRPLLLILQLWRPVFLASLPARHLYIQEQPYTESVYIVTFLGERRKGRLNTPQIYFKCICHKLKPNKSHFNFH